MTADGQHPHRLRARAPGPLLGHARRRRQPRRGDPVRAPAAPDRPDRPGRAADLPRPDGGRVLRNFDEVMADAPDAVGSGVALLTAPHEEFVPEPVRGQPVVGVVACYAGPVEEAEEALRPLREFGPPALDMVEPMPVRGPPAALRRRLPAPGSATTGPATSSPASRTRRSRSCAASTSPSRPRAPRSSCSPAAAPARGCRTARWRSGSARRRSTSTSPRCGRTPPTTRPTSRGRASSARRSSRSRRAASTSTSSATRARSGSSRRSAPTATGACRRSRTATTRATSSAPARTSSRAGATP